MRVSRSVRAVAAAGLTLGVLVLTASPASAHVSITGDVRAGGNGTFTFTVPNERDDANTVEVTVQIPEDVPLGSFRTQPKPGWDVAVTTRTLEEPVEVFGEPVSEVVDTVTWTTTGPGIGPDQYDTFGVRGGTFPEDATEVMFPTVQTYSSGEEVAWIEPTPEGGEEPEHPAPVLQLLPAEDEEEDPAAAADDTEEAAADTEDDDSDSSNALAIVSLVIGLAGLALAGLAFTTARRKTT